MFGPIRRKCADYDVATGAQGLFYARRIGIALGCPGQEMKGRPVVPEIIDASRLPRRLHRRKSTSLWRPSAQAAI